MFTVSESTTIARPATAVFETAADPFTQLKWDRATLKSVEQLTPGPLGRGTRYRGQFKGFGQIDYEFVEYEPGHTFAHQAAMKMGAMQHRFEFTQVPTGTRIVQSMVVEPTGKWKLLAPLMQMMIRRRLRAINAELGHYLAMHEERGVLPAE